jgi:hypothetical protein
MEYLHSTGFSNDAKRRILAGEDPQGLVHIIWGGEAPSGLSSTLTLVEYQRGGYTSTYFTLEEVANGQIDQLWITDDEPED